VCKRLQQQIDNMATNTDNSTVNKSKPAVHCCVPLCTSDSRYNPELHFHHIPKNPELKRQWIIKIRRDEGPLFYESIFHFQYFCSFQMKSTVSLIRSNQKLLTFLFFHSLKIYRKCFYKY
jgi:hypothetical protein